MPPWFAIPFVGETQSREAHLQARLVPALQLPGVVATVQPTVDLGLERWVRLI